jgi:hypothetical protein
VERHLQGADRGEGNLKIKDEDKNICGGVMDTKEAMKISQKMKWFVKNEKGEIVETAEQGNGVTKIKKVIRNGDGNKAQL